MKGIIIYKSKYGSTKKYAQWISEATGFECVETSAVNVNELSLYDTVILGGGVYASGIACVSFLRKNYSKLEGKKIIVFTCGASPYDEKSVKAVVDQNMKDELAGIPVFYFRGGFDLKSMKFADRTLCKMLRKVVSKKDPKDYEVWEKAIMEVKDDEACDWTDKSYIEPLLEYLQVHK